MWFCFPASSQSSIHLQTSRKTAESTPPHKTHFFENLNWNWWLQVCPKFSLPIFKHPTKSKAHATEERPKVGAPKAAYTCRLLLISPESSPPSQTYFLLNVLIETVDYKLLQKSAFQFSNILPRSKVKYSAYSRAQIHYVQATSNTLQVDWFKYITHRLLWNE